MINELQKVNLRKGYTPEESKDIIEEIFGFRPKDVKQTTESE